MTQPDELLYENIKIFSGCLIQPPPHLIYANPFVEFRTLDKIISNCINITLESNKMLSFHA